MDEGQGTGDPGDRPAPRPRPTPIGPPGGGPADPAGAAHPGGAAHPAGAAHPGGAAERAEPAGDGLAARYLRRRRRKRRAKKQRLAAMSRRRRVGRRAMISGTWLLGALAALLVTTIILYFTVADVPRPESLPLPQVATIQYSDGSTIARIGSVDRKVVALTQVPANTRWAVLAAEDRNFYSEPGVSITGTMRAAWTDLTGGDTQGGSGITQQYVKNAYLNNEQTITRKLKELMIAVKLAREYSKDQILEFYLNTVYFGRGAYGIQAAAQAYFGENVEKLTVAQSALLAGLLRAPAYYDPAAGNRTVSEQRWKYVLDGMVTTGHLSAADEAKLAFPVTKPPRGTGLGTSGWKYLLVQRVLAELAQHGISADEVNQRGLTIRTTIDRKAQAAAVSAIKTTFKNLTKKQRNLKNSLVAVNPATGGVIAYYGGSGPGVPGYDGKVDFNDWAGVNANPPGSSFKPYTLATVLAQTLQQKTGADHFAINSDVDGSYCRLIDGTKICNDPGDKSVSRSKIKLALAMKYSLNTTFDLLALDAGPDEVATTAHAMGVGATDSAGHKTLADSDGTTNFGIGIGDYPVTPLDQAVGYATLANDGMRNVAYLVQQAVGSDGSIVYRHAAKATRAIDAKVANDVTLTLEPIAAYSGVPLANGRKSAAKTGTEGIGPKTTDNSDAWMVGFTPQVSAAVWVGTGKHEPIFDASGKPLYGSELPGKTWQLFMDTYLHGAKHEKMPSKQLISADGSTPKNTPSPTKTRTTSSTPATSSAKPKPTFSITTGFPTPPATSSAPRTTYSPPPPPPPTTTAATCTPTVLQPC
ncbi:transglycosylase domain-containing protein [uncultured Jatrophihabitans sp.]|uniref:transglycosylase domain-containing protein n=1 Tax=uncultured Jatrophihabitans sp. TaxID=1610747 RepID=UPI0035CC7EC5